MPKPWAGTMDVDRVTVLSQDWPLVVVITFIGRAPPPGFVRRRCQSRKCAVIAFAQGTPGITGRANYLWTGFFPARTSNSSSPYFSSFDGPIPLILSMPARFDGFTSAIASRVASEKTTNAGTSSASARPRRQVFSVSNSSSSYGIGQSEQKPRLRSRALASGFWQSLHAEAFARLRPFAAAGASGRSITEGGRSEDRNRDGLRRA